MEEMPCSVISIILCNLDDVRSLAHFALASRRCRDAVARADLVRRNSMPVLDYQQVLHPANAKHAQLTTAQGFKHCLLCFMCKCLIPAPFEAVVVNHRCSDHTWFHPMWTNQDVVLYRGGETSHLPQPAACSEERLKAYQVARPAVYPYAPLLA